MKVLLSVLVLLVSGWADATVCRIELGVGSNNSPSRRVVEVNLKPGESKLAVYAFEFPVFYVYGTQGDCVFKLFGAQNFRGEFVELGTGLSRKIRLGPKGITKRDTGGRGTWLGHSLIISAVEEIACIMRVGSFDVQMDYFSPVTRIPESTHIFKAYPVGKRLCLFTAYEGINHNKEGWRWVHIGQKLSQRIRAGLMGVLKRHIGGADTWPIQGLQIFRLRLPADKLCTAVVGAPKIEAASGTFPGVVMDYVTPLADIIPKMNHIYGTFGNCRTAFYEGTNFNQSGPNWRRLDYLEPEQKFTRLLFYMQSIAHLPKTN